MASDTLSITDNRTVRRRAQQTVSVPEPKPLAVQIVALLLLVVLIVVLVVLC